MRYSTPQQLAEALHLQVETKKHFYKHATGIQGSQAKYAEADIKAYVDDAVAATTLWAKEQKRNFTYEEPSLDGSAASMRVINSPDIYLVMTKENPVRIVSYRNRRKYGF